MCQPRFGYFGDGASQKLFFQLKYKAAKHIFYIKFANGNMLNSPIIHSELSNMEDEGPGDLARYLSDIYLINMCENLCDKPELDAVYYYCLQLACCEFLQCVDYFAGLDEFLSIAGWSIWPLVPQVGQLALAIFAECHSIFLTNFSFCIAGYASVVIESNIHSQRPDIGGSYNPRGPGFNPPLY
jgi:hypothetical protein